MQNKSTTIIIVLLVVIVVVLGVIAFKKPKPITVTTIPEATDAQVKPEDSSTKKYESSKLGFSFEYPSVWGTVIEKINNNSEDAFEYELDFSETMAVKVFGKSYPYKNAGRDGYDADLVESEITGSDSGCPGLVVESASTAFGEKGVYAEGQIIAGLGDCLDSRSNVRYGVFDVNKKVTNIVFEAAPESVTKAEFLKVLASLSF